MAKEKKAKTLYSRKAVKEFIAKKSKEMNLDFGGKELKVEKAVYPVLEEKFEALILAALPKAQGKKTAVLHPEDFD